MNPDREFENFLRITNEVEGLRASLAHAEALHGKLREEIAALRDALKPFAEWYRILCGKGARIPLDELTVPSGWLLSGSPVLVVGNCRRAAELVPEEEAK